MAQLFLNNAGTTLNGGITNVVTSITVANGAVFGTVTAPDYILATIANAGAETSWEVVKITAVAANVLTVVRAQEGTTGVAWSSGDTIDIRDTKTVMNAVGNSIDLGQTNFSGMVWRGTESAASNVSTASTSSVNLLTLLNNKLGSLAFSGNTFKAGHTLRFKAWGKIVNDATRATFTLYAGFNAGGASDMSVVAQTSGVAYASVTIYWCLDVELILQAVGASGKLVGVAVLSTSSNSGDRDLGDVQVANFTTLDTTATQTFNLYGQTALATCPLYIMGATLHVDGIL